MTSASDAMEILAKQEISRNEFKDFIRDLTSSESSLKKGRNIVLERRRHFDVFLEVLCARMNQVPVTERKSMMYLLDMIVTKAHEKHDKKVLAMVQPQLPELFSMMVPVHSAVHAPAAEKLLKRWRQQHVFDDDERLNEVEELIDLKRRLKKGRTHREKDSAKKEGRKRSSTSRSGEKDKDKNNKDKVHHHHQRKREHSRGREHGDRRDATASLRAIEADRKAEKRRRLHETKPDGEDSHRASSGSSRLSSAVQHLLQDEPTEIGVAENPSPFRQD